MLFIRVFCCLLTTTSPDDRWLPAVEDRLDEPAAARIGAGEDAGTVLARRVETRRAARHIGAGAEGAACAGDDDRPHLVHAVDGVEDVDQLAAHRRVEGIELVWAVQRDGHHDVVELGQQRLVRDVGRFSGSAQRGRMSLRDCAVWETVAAARSNRNRGGSRCLTC